MVPCCCVGASRYVHSSCLNRQRLQNGLFAESFWTCSVCGADYRMKAYGNFLRLMTAWPAVVLLSAICCFVVVFIASQVFQALLPLVGPLAPKFDSDKDTQDTQEGTFVFEFKLHRVDLGYWAGGIIVITISRKIHDAWKENSFCGLLSFVTFVPSLLTMAKHEDWRNTFCLMLSIYSFYNTSFMFLAVFTLMRGLSSVFVGEQVVDFVGLPVEDAQPVTLTEPKETKNDVCENETEMCLCCWDLPAKYKMKSCGHVVACDVCRKRLIYREMKCNAGGAGTGAVPRMRSLTARHLEQTRVTCPLCRRTDVMVVA